MGRIAYCTIASANYLSRVQLLLESLKQHQPEATVEVLLCETPEVCLRISSETKRRFWSPADVCPDWRSMAFYYSLIEFNTALKPFFINRLLEEGFDGVVYLDPDIEVYSSLESIETILETSDVVLTPHVCAPVPQDGRRPAMEEYLRAGQFNLGFIALAATENGRAMLKWWQDVCFERCLFDASHRYFVDQFWAAAFASFAERMCVLRDPGCNVAYWNVFQRRLTREGTTWLVDGKPLRFFHFSGLHESDLTQVSKYQDRVTAPDGTALYDLLNEYVGNLSIQEWKSYACTPYSFGYFSDGEQISRDDRRNYLYLSAKDRRNILDPFASREAIRDIVAIPISGDIHTYVTAVRRERLRLKLTALWTEFKRSITRRGIVDTSFRTLRYVYRTALGRKRNR